MKRVKIGQLLVAEGLITKEQLLQALQIQKRSSSYKPLGRILVDESIITEKQLNHILDKYRKRPRLGELLLKSGAITPEMLEAGLQQHERSGKPLGETLVKMNFISEETMREALCTQLNIAFIDLDSVAINPELGNLISDRYAERYHVIPVSKIGDTLTLAMDDPTRDKVIEEIRLFTGLEIRVVTATREALRKAYQRLYQADATDVATESATEVIGEFVEAEDQDRMRISSVQEKRADKLLQHIISLAVTRGASDIHVETLNSRMIIRFRVDGVLQELGQENLQEEINRERRALISRIKILAKLDIAEKRRPQDGSFQVRIVKEGESRNLDIRVSIVPAYYGENAVMRILDPRNAPASVDHLGFSRRIRDGLVRLLERTNGIILITGPTGSGKSTTLYGALMTLYRPGIKILTAEDPIEYVYENITQCEVNERIGNSFAKYIRAFLRQDPEVILIGEIRDDETAEMAFRAAQTGHLVLSTMHTNDAVGTITRLLDLKVDPSLINSCLSGVLSQRLARRICPHCKREYTPAKEILREFFDGHPQGFTWYAGQKCHQCHFSGYRGRIAIGELWVPSDRDRFLISKSASFDEIRESSEETTVNMAEDALDKLHNGVTNLEELLRVLPYSNVYRFRQMTQQLAGRPA